MFEEYLQDAAYFVNQARRETEEGHEEEARRFYRVAVMLGAAAMETFVNFLGGTFETAGAAALQPYELALLTDKRFGQEDGTFRIGKQAAYSRLEDKLRFLIRRFNVKVDPASSREWGEFLKFKRHRDDLIHSRMTEDNTPLTEYERACSTGIRATFALMDSLSMGVFSKHLRAKLQDLADLDT
ncbi:MAG TPA: hypothetical protein VFS30_09320 [Dehalococcoidia bacterium]|nr:hypothetical protein [Dehalococcoidia bacterium]